MPNPYKNLPDTIGDAIHVKVRLLLVSSGYMYCDREYMFRKRLTNSKNEFYKAKVDQDYYVEFFMVDQQGNAINLNDICKTDKGGPLRNQLPSQLFEECTQGDRIFFVLNGIKIVMEMDQKLNRPGQPNSELTFEDALEYIRRSIPEGKAKFEWDVPVDAEVYKILRTTVWRNSIFFHPKSNLLVRPPLTKSQWSDKIKQPITVKDLSDVPSPYSDQVELLKTRVQTNPDDTLQLTVPLQGQNSIPDFTLIETADYLYLYAKSPEGKGYQKDFIGLVLEQPEFRNGMSVVGFYAGLLTLCSKTPEIENQTSCTIV